MRKRTLEHQKGRVLLTHSTNYNSWDVLTSQPENCSLNDCSLLAGNDYVLAATTVTIIIIKSDNPSVILPLKWQPAASKMLLALCCLYFQSREGCFFFFFSLYLIQPPPVTVLLGWNHTGRRAHTHKWMHWELRRGSWITKPLLHKHLLSELSGCLCCSEEALTGTLVHHF